VSIPICSKPECTKPVATGSGCTGKYCSKSCAASVNNKIPKRKRVARGPCIACGADVSSYSAKYCSLECSFEFKDREKISSWLSGAWDGSTSSGAVSRYVRRYLLKEANNACTECGWSEKNPHIDKVILTLDHVDGNWKNNRPENLRVLCYNCHTLTPTFNALNKNNPLRQGGRQYNHRHQKK